MGWSDVSTGELGFGFGYTGEVCLAVGEVGVDFGIVRFEGLDLI